MCTCVCLRCIMSYVLRWGKPTKLVFVTNRLGSTCQSTQKAMDLSQRGEPGMDYEMDELWHMNASFLYNDTCSGHL